MGLNRKFIALVAGSSGQTLSSGKVAKLALAEGCGACWLVAHELGFSYTHTYGKSNPCLCNSEVTLNVPKSHYKFIFLRCSIIHGTFQISQGIFNSVIQPGCRCLAYLVLLSSSSCSFYIEDQSNGEERVKAMRSLPTQLALLAPPKAEGGHVYQDFKLYGQGLLLLPLQSPRNSERMEVWMARKRERVGFSEC